jgi:glucose/mannose transport system substrate-binding protein
MQRYGWPRLPRNVVAGPVQSGGVQMQKSLLPRLIGSVAGLAMMTGVTFAQEESVDVVHWWTSGGEAAALNVLKENLEKQGVTWNDVPIAGGAGAQAMTALRAMVTAGNVPTAVQMLGFDITDWAEQGVVADLNELGSREKWDDVVPAALQKFAKYEDKWIAAPVNVHSVNWIWVNKAAMDKIGVTEAPTSMDELFAMLDKAKEAGLIPLAQGGQPWQEATMFDSVVIATNGLDFYKKAFIDLDESAINSPEMAKAFRKPRQARRLRRPGDVGPRMEPCHRHGGEGRCAAAGDGRLGEGRVQRRRQEAGHRLHVLPLPRHAGQRDLQLRHVRAVRGRRGAPRRAGEARSAVLDPGFSRLQRGKGLCPGPHRRADADFDECGKKAWPTSRKPTRKGTLLGSLAQGYGQPTAIKNAYYDVVTHGLPRPDDGAGRTRPLSPRRSTRRSSRSTGLAL